MKNTTIENVLTTSIVKVKGTQTGKTTAGYPGVNGVTRKPSAKEQIIKPIITSHELKKSLIDGKILTVIRKDSVIKCIR
jgi:hypothetical protein